MHATATNDDIQNRLWYEKINYDFKKKVFLKKSRKVSKNAELHADFKSVKKVGKKWTWKKLSAKEIWWKWVKGHFYLCSWNQFGL